MIITRHGNKKHPFYKGVTHHLGRRLVFFGISALHVSRKEDDWILANMDRLNAESAPQVKQRPALKLVSNNK